MWRQYEALTFQTGHIKWVSSKAAAFLVNKEGFSH